MKKSKLLPFAFFLLTFIPVWDALRCCQTAGACNKDSNDPNDPNEPVELLRHKWDAVTSILKNKEIDEEVKEKKINKILTPLFDFSLMAKLSLGRKHWPKLTPEEREKFNELFIKRLKSTYREKIASYIPKYFGKKVVFKQPVQKSNRISYIPMELLSEEKKIDILYKLRRVKIIRKVKVGENSKRRVYKRWKIYDVQIKGVSILLSYRAQFDDILSHGTVDELLSKLEKPAGATNAK